MGHLNDHLTQCLSLEELPKRDDLTERHTLSFFSSFSRSLSLSLLLLLLWLSYTSLSEGGSPVQRWLLLSLHWDTFFSYSYTLVMDVLADNQAQANAAADNQNNNSDYMGLALKQWSVYLGNVLLNFIHKECKNGHMCSTSASGSPTATQSTTAMHQQAPSLTNMQLQQQQQQSNQFYKNNYCPCCHYNYQQHHHNQNGSYYNYAQFLGSQRQYVRSYHTCTRYYNVTASRNTG